MTSGLLVVDKPQGITSHQVVARARRAIGTKKVGHAGTLDPMATGVLVLGIGKGTRLLGHLALTTKTYTATIRLGQATDTDDADGHVTDAAGAALTAVGPRLSAALAELTGTISQVPSSVSAIKVDGQRAYARVRKGEDVQLAARRVTVSRFDALDVRTADADGVAVVDVEVVVDCSSGTYIRALARDLGDALGTGGHLTALRRTAVGPFTLAHVTWDAQLDGLAPGESADVRPYRLAEIAPLCFATLEVDAAAAAAIAHGRGLRWPVPADPTALVHAGELLALYRPDPADAAVSLPVAVLV
ncbi:tRNA pseudouridine(55) synthase TruB [Propioniciclava sp.]|uniref:tRNA pseudouridine(55) synthase TruB n=1 Tax=Propioniciclava sp. TaxID=2038686 RepID=UPI002615CAAA|nr:tRNA pseudouridine(55) synthase TruB [Propioniciclava sp.]